jgi:hypothetical protein
MEAVSDALDARHGLHLDLPDTKRPDFLHPLFLDAAMRGKLEHRLPNGCFSLSARPIRLARRGYHSRAIIDQPAEPYGRVRVSKNLES